MMAIEDEFAFEIPLTDAEKLKTPKDIFKFICEREDVFEWRDETIGKLPSMGIPTVARV